MRSSAFTSWCAIGLACAPAADLCDTLDVRRNAIKFAHADAGARVGTAEASVVAIHSQATFIEPQASLYCTATRIAPGVYLTARHCVPNDAVWEASGTPTRSDDPAPLPDSSTSDTSQTTSDAATGPEVRLPQLFIHHRPKTTNSACGRTSPASWRVTRAALHRHLDLALLFSNEPAPGARAPAPAMTLAQDAPRRGASLFIAGYGLTEDASLGALRALEVTVTSTGQHIEVQGTTGDACIGDSGGPLYSRETEPPTLWGVLSNGSASCLGADRYVQVSRARDWIRHQLRVQGS